MGDDAESAWRNVVSVLGGDTPFTFIEDGRQGPMDIPVPTVRADSPADALRIIAKHGGGEAGGASGATTASAGGERVPATKVGRNEACPCGSGLKFKRCCGAR